MFTQCNSLKTNCVKIGWICLVWLILTIGVLQAQSKADKNKAKDEALKELAHQIGIYDCELRGLKFKKPVDVSVYTIDELRNFMKGEVENSLPPQKAYAYKKLLVEFGIIPPDTNIKEVLINLYTSQIAGFYDPRSKQLKMIRYTRKNPMPEEIKAIEPWLRLIGKSYDGFVMAHELTHALQDQNFDLLTVPIENDFNEDLGMAVRSVVEGDAMKVMYQYLLGSKESIFRDVRAGQYGVAKVAGVPQFLVDQLTFPYTEGYKFVSTVCGNNNWVYVNDLFSDLPASTKQIMNPEKCYIKKRDYPIDITLPDVLGVLGPKWTKVGNPNVWGEFSIQLILKNFNLKRYDGDDFNDKWINIVTKGWEGDKYALFEKKAETQDANDDTKNAATLIWFTTWDTPKDAQEFFDAYKLAIDKKYKDITGLSTEGSVEYPISDSFATDIDIKANDVLIIDNAPKDKIKMISEAIWGGVKKEEIKKVERLKKPMR